MKIANRIIAASLSLTVFSNILNAATIESGMTLQPMTLNLYSPTALSNSGIIMEPSMDVGGTLNQTDPISNGIELQESTPMNGHAISAKAALGQMTGNLKGAKAPDERSGLQFDGAANFDKHGLVMVGVAHKENQKEFVLDIPSSEATDTLVDALGLEVGYARPQTLTISLGSAGSLKAKASSRATPNGDRIESRYAFFYINAQSSDVKVAENTVTITLNGRNAARLYNAVKLPARNGTKSIQGDGFTFNLKTNKAIIVLPKN